VNTHAINVAGFDGTLPSGGWVHPVTATFNFLFGIQAYTRPKWLTDRQPARYVGRYQIGEKVSVFAKCVPGGKSIQPTVAGLMRVYGGSSIVRNAILPVESTDQRSVGLFRGRFTPDNTDSPGRYFALLSFFADGRPRAEVLAFELLPGGNALGAIMSVFSTTRPDNSVLLAHTEAGKVTTGRGAYLDEGV